MGVGNEVSKVLSLLGERRGPGHSPWADGSFPVCCPPCPWESQHQLPDAALGNFPPDKAKAEKKGLFLFLFFFSLLFADRTCEECAFLKLGRSGFKSPFSHFIAGSS